MMILKFILVFFEFIAINCFVSYPFNAEYLLESFLTSLPQPQLNLSSQSIPGEMCNRQCDNNSPQVCHFKFTLEYYQILGGACNNCTKNNRDCLNEFCVTADGIERTFMSVNRQLPGPSIIVCKNDIVIVDVDNQMDGTATSIHWHGLLQQETPFSDGVPFITQYPIAYSTNFRYIFHARQKGSHLYHSHAGQHKANGIYGALIVKDDGIAVDGEFHMICSDWMHLHAEEYFPGLSSTISLFQSILINGRSRYYNQTTKSFTSTPLTHFQVSPNKNYLFRVINAASNVCPFQLQIENHNFTVVASDGSYIEAKTVEKLFFTSGERYDIIVRANRDIGDYFIHVRALSPCNDTIVGYAVMRYEGVDDVVERELVKFDEDEEVVIGNEMLEFRGSEKNEIVDAAIDHKFSLFFATPQLDNDVLFNTRNHIKFMTTSDKFNNNNIGTINNISLSLPHFPLTSHHHQLNDSLFCNSTAPKQNCIKNSSICECIHRLKVNLNSIVELLLIDIEDHSRHPFHLHGHKFYVMEMGKIDTFDEKFTKPVLKDTVTIPRVGYVKIKFKANNPGFWLAHCHFDYHLAIGMGFILQVGEISEMRDKFDGFSDEIGFTKDFI